MNTLSKKIRALLLFAFLLAWLPCEAGAEPFALHLLDVGQGQALLESDGQYMLIDGGGRAASSYLVSAVSGLVPDRLAYAAVSHYDEDHMSGLIGALKVFGCDMVLVPPYPGEGDLYRSFTEAAVSNGAVIFHPPLGWTCELGGAVVQVVGPAGSGYETENDLSLVFRVTYGDTAFLISGDAQSQSEADMAAGDLPLSADVYVAGHHGSATSSSDVFLDAVSPAFVMISCGSGNAYGHPAGETLERLRERDIGLFRTDLQGTVTAYSDGTSVWFDAEPSQDWTPGSGEPEQNVRSIPSGGAGGGEITYVCNTSTMKFHYPYCDSVGNMNPKNRMDTDMTREELIALGYDPCGNCRP